MVFAFAGDSTMTKFLGIVIYDTLISACKSREKRHYIMYRLIKKRIPPLFRGGCQIGNSSRFRALAVLVEFNGFEAVLLVDSCFFCS